jgi:hypothetical protein
MKRLTKRKSARAAPLKYASGDPFSGNWRVVATQTIQSRHARETYETARKSLTPIDHMLFTRLVISGAAS